MSDRRGVVARGGVSTEAGGGSGTYWEEKWTGGGALEIAGTTQIAQAQVSQYKTEVPRRRRIFAVNGR